MDVDEGNNLDLMCEANGKPAPSIAWTKSGTTLQTGSGTNTLQLTNIQRSGGGNYVCTAKNMAGSASFNVLVRIVRCEYCFFLTLVFSCIYTLRYRFKYTSCSVVIVRRKSRIANRKLIVADEDLLSNKLVRVKSL